MNILGMNPSWRLSNPPLDEQHGDTAFARGTNEQGSTPGYAPRLQLDGLGSLPIRQYGHSWVVTVARPRPRRGIGPRSGRHLNHMLAPCCAVARASAGSACSRPWGSTGGSGAPSTTVKSTGCHHLSGQHHLLDAPTDTTVVSGDKGTDRSARNRWRHNT
jgi:hypothetical protein